MVDFLMPESERDKGENPIVDSLAMASDWTVVSKCALHGLIYVWDLKATVKNIDNEDVTKGEQNKVVEQDVTMLGHLKWSDTDNFYMNLGCHKGMYIAKNPSLCSRFQLAFILRQRFDLLWRRQGFIVAVQHTSIRQRFANAPNQIPNGSEHTSPLARIAR